MPTIADALDPHRRAMVQVEVAVPPARARSRLLGGLQGAIRQGGSALLDTGSNLTLIDRGLRQSLNLTPFNRARFLTPSSGPNPPPSLLYKVDLTVLHPNGNPQQNLVIQRLTVSEANLTPMGNDVLLGVDVLARCCFLYDGQALVFSLDY